MVSYKCDKCHSEFDTCLEMVSFKIDGVQYDICDDCLREWLRV